MKGLLVNQKIGRARCEPARATRSEDKKDRPSRFRHYTLSAPLQNRLLRQALGKAVEMTAYTRGLAFSVKELGEALEKGSFPPASPVLTIACFPSP